MVLDLVVQMVAHGHECCVFYQKEVEEGMKVVDYPCEVRRLQSWDDLNGYDVVHAHGMGPEMLALKAKLKTKSFKFFAEQSGKAERQGSSSKFQVSSCKIQVSTGDDIALLLLPGLL